MGAHLRERVHRLLEPASERDGLSRFVDKLIIGIIVVSVVSVILESVESLRNRAPLAFEAIEWASVAFLSLEYVLRVWSCVEDPK